MTNIATNEPTELRAGLTWQWTREDLVDYPASTWTLKYWLKKTGATGANLSIPAVADGDYFDVTVAASTTATYTAGEYTWVAVVTAGSEAFEVDHGRLTILPRYDAASNLDDRSHARVVLEAIEAVIEGRASKDQEEYTIGNRSLKRTPMKDLREMHTYYANKVAAEEAEDRLDAGEVGGRRLLARL